MSLRAFETNTNERLRIENVSSPILQRNHQRSLSGFADLPLLSLHTQTRLRIENVSSPILQQNHQQFPNDPPTNHQRLPNESSTIPQRFSNESSTIPQRIINNSPTILQRIINNSVGSSAIAASDPEFVNNVSSPILQRSFDDSALFSDLVLSEFPNDSATIHQQFLNDSSTILQRFANDSSAIGQRLANDFVGTPATLFVPKNAEPYEQSIASNCVLWNGKRLHLPSIRSHFSHGGPNYPVSIGTSLYGENILITGCDLSNGDIILNHNTRIIGHTGTGVDGNPIQIHDGIHTAAGLVYIVDRPLVPFAIQHASCW